MSSSSLLATIEFDYCTLHRQGTMSVIVQHMFDGLATEIKVQHHLGNLIPEVGLDQLLNLYVKKALEAAKRKLGCFKYYSFYEASFKVCFISCF
jgi:hypothetical protein